MCSFQWDKIWRTFFKKSKSSPVSYNIIEVTDWNNAMIIEWFSTWCAKTHEWILDDSWMAVHAWSTGDTVSCWKWNKIHSKSTIQVAFSQIYTQYKRQWVMIRKSSTVSRVVQLFFSKIFSLLPSIRFAKICGCYDVEFLTKLCFLRGFCYVLARSNGDIFLMFLYESILKYKFVLKMKQVNKIKRYRKVKRTLSL